MRRADEGGYAFRYPGYLAMVASVAILSLAVVGCGDDASSTNSAATTSAAAQTNAAAGTSVAQASAAIAPFEKAPDSIGLTEKLSHIPKGATVAYMQCAVPECTAIGKSLDEAAKAMGVTLEKIDVGNTPETFTKGFSIAVQKKPDAVLVPALDPVIYPKQLKQLAAAKIPVVGWTIPQGTGNGITANLLPKSFYARNGKLMADYIVAKSDGDANVLYVTAPEYTIFNVQAQTFEQEMKRACPTCKHETVSISVAEIGTGIPGRVVSYLQQHPKTDWVVGGFGSILTGVPEALKTAALSDKVKLMSHAGGAANFQYVKSGGETVEFALDKKILAWKALDTAARAINGESVEPDGENPVPTEFLTQDKIAFDPAKEWAGVPSYQEDFKKLWGVQ